MSTNVNLTVAIPGQNGTVATYSNPRSNNTSIATATIIGPNPSGHVYLDVKKLVQVQLRLLLTIQVVMEQLGQ